MLTAGVTVHIVAVRRGDAGQKSRGRPPASGRPFELLDSDLDVLVRHRLLPQPDGVEGFGLAPEAEQHLD
jgi:hypothetical protein